MPPATARALLLALGLLLAGCLPPGELGLEHQPSGLAAPMPHADFAAYVEAAQEHIRRGATGGATPLPPDVVEARAPFEFEPDPQRCRATSAGRWREGVLLLHGLAGTPYEVRDLGRALAEACRLVRAILLPGHGTVPGDLLEIDHGAWLEAARRGVASFAGRVDVLHLAGFSEGGALALHPALQGALPQGTDPGALVLIAPTLEARPFAAFLQNGLVSSGDPRAQWSTIGPDDDPIRYEALPWHALAQRDELAAALPGRVDRPVFLVLSAEDASLDASAARRWFCRELVGPRRLIWYASTPEPVSDCRFVAVRASSGPGILDYAHAGLPIAPDNPRYGRDAREYDCRHYWWEADSPDWLLCADRAKTPENSSIRYGEVRAANLERAIVRRLTYNPDFERLAGEIVAFLHEVDKARDAPVPRLRPVSERVASPDSIEESTGAPIPRLRPAR